MVKHDEDKLDPQEMATIAKTRADFYSFLNLHFSIIPDIAFVEQLYNGELNTALNALVNDESMEPEITTGARLMSDFLESHRGDEKNKLSEILGVDRTRLYRGVAQGYGPPPPYEMVWSKLAQGYEVLMIVAGEYRKAGLEPSADARERVDYIGLEMDFMRELALREATAWESDEIETARNLLTSQLAFLDEHLGAWAPYFIEKALEQSETDFYRGHLKMIRGFLSAQKRELELLGEQS
jgi:TorA maturation chaperone TorD